LLLIITPTCQAEHADKDHTGCRSHRAPETARGTAVETTAHGKVAHRGTDIVIGGIVRRTEECTQPAFLLLRGFALEVAADESLYFVGV
jgi:hypothetical protein